MSSKRLNLTELAKQEIELIKLLNKYIEKNFKHLNALEVASYYVEQGIGEIFYTIMLKPKDRYVYDTQRVSIEITLNVLKHFVKLQSCVTIDDLLSLGFQSNLDKEGNLKIFYLKLKNTNDFIIVMNPETESEMIFKQENIDSGLTMSLVVGENERITLEELIQLTKL